MLFFVLLFLTFKVLVDGPETGVRRQSLTTKRIALTDIVVPIPHGAKYKAVKKAYIKADVNGQWAKTGWAKKRAARAHKASLNDFDRFQVMLARKRVQIRFSTTNPLFMFLPVFLI
jgi:large subunit ribosomal protein L14e